MIEQYATKYVKEVCKVGQGEEQCKFLGISIEENGPWLCEKIFPEMKALTILRTTITAEGDNCEGNNNLNIEE